MIRISRETDYGIVLLTHIVNSAEGSTYSARALAARTHLPVPMVSKILKQLVRDGLLFSQRGVKGGYYLARHPENISVAEIISAVEGPIAMTMCVSTPGECRQEGFCGVRPNWLRINEAVRGALQGITLSEMARPLSGPQGPSLVHII